MQAGERRLAGEDAEWVWRERTAPLRPGEAALRRAVLVDPAPGRVRAALEDDFHHFEIEIAHAGGIITVVSATTIRHPWTTCAGAGPLLVERLRGRRLADAAAFDSPYAHCTHLYDLAGLAASRACTERPVLFRMAVTDAVDGRREALIDRDGAPVHAWTLDRETILPPHPYAGRNLRALRQWVTELDPGEAEAALLLRRAVFISIGRTFDPDVQRDVPTPPPGACFTHQPENFDPDARARGSRRDFSEGRAGPLADRIAALAEQ